MNVYLFQIFNGLGIGAIYFLLAVGLSIIFGLLGFVNFAHGALYMLGAYFTLLVLDGTGSFVIALIAAPLIVAAMGALLERHLFCHAHRLPHIAQILISAGVALIIGELVRIAWGPEPHSIPVPQALSGVVWLGSFPYPSYRLFVTAAVAVIGIALWLLIERTRFGSMIRAGSESREMVALLGVPVRRLYMATFALGAGLAGLAGALAAPIRGADPAMGLEAITIAFVVVVLGGMGSFLGTLVGGLLIGVVQSVMSTAWPEGARMMIFITMAAVLLLMPRGLVGRA